MQLRVWFIILYCQWRWHAWRGSHTTITAWPTTVLSQRGKEGAPLSWDIHESCCWVRTARILTELLGGLKYYYLLHLLFNRKARRSHRFSINSEGNILISFKTKNTSSIFKTSLGGLGTSGLICMIHCRQLHVNCGCPVQDSFTAQTNVCEDVHGFKPSLVAVWFRNWLKLTGCLTADWKPIAECTGAPAQTAALWSKFNGGGLRGPGSYVAVPAMQE